MKKTIQIILCLFSSALFASAVPQKIKMFGQTYSIVVPEKIPETALTWSEAKPAVESLLANKDKQKSLEISLKNIGIDLAKKYEDELQRVAKQNKMDPDEIAGIFQSNKGKEKWQQVQTLHNTMVGINHLYDTVVKNPPEAIQTSKPPTVPENKPEPVTPKTSVEWGSSQKP